MSMNELRIALRQGGEAFLDLLFPKDGLCIHCHDERAAEQGLCLACAQHLFPSAPPKCERCGRPLQHEGPLCGACQKSLPPFAGAAAPFLYRGLAGEMVREMKYHEKKRYANFLGDAMARCLQALEGPRPDVLVPVPLHRSRMRERGYNQAQWLSARVSLHCGAPVLPNALSRVRETDRQTHLETRAREKNVHDAFAVHKSRAIRGKRVLLIDDVLTTGATARNCARALLAGGAAQVWVLTATTVAWRPDTGRLEDWEEA